MKIDPFVLLEQTRTELHKREEQLSQRHNNMNKRLLEHNSLLDKLIKGYVKMNLIQDDNVEYSKPITQTEFHSEFNNLQRQLKAVNLTPHTEEHKISTQKNIEQYIAQSIILFGKRWNTINAIQEKSSNERVILKENEINILKELNQLGKNTKIKEREFISAVNILCGEHIKLIEEQNSKLKKEERLQDDKDKLIELREDFFKIASELFIL